MLGLAVAATAALVSAGYQSMAPTGQWYGRAFCRGPRDSKQIALTFDDGPNDPHTLNLLDVLSKHNIRATFFVIGKYVRRRPDIVQEIARRGHVIGNHTFTHPLLIFEPAKRIREEIILCRAAINDAIGDHSNLFRPPWGGRRPQVFRTARDLGLEPVMWNITGYDWKSSSPKFIQQKIEAKLRGGNVILLHDGGHEAFGTDRSKTVEFVDRFLTQYKSKYELATVSDMAVRAKDRNATLSGK